MLSSLKVVLAIGLLALTTGCASTNTGITLDQLSGVYTAVSTDGHTFAAIRLNPCPPYGYLTGYVYSTQAAADREAASGVGTPLNNAAVLSGYVEYSDPLKVGLHVNSLLSAESISIDSAGKQAGAEIQGTAYVESGQVFLSVGEFQKLIPYKK